MAKLIDIRKTGTKAEIDRLKYPADQRTYLGMSSIGHGCRRFLWYQFRWAFREEFSSRQMRLFGRGHKEEPIIIAELAKIGIVVKDGADNQVGYVGCFGHYMGHSDGKAFNVPEAPKTTHLAEFKTINDKGFKQLLKLGLQKSKLVYYSQMQAYMKEENLTRGLFIAVNKNDDNWYVERVYYDKGFAEDLTRKAEEIIFSPIPDVRTLPPSWFECGWCPAKDICEGRKEPNKNCRTCKHSAPIPDGKWLCNHFNVEIATETQKAGKDCTKYERY